ncbi:hypothetical protein R1sor_015551 [Riccia sorocarpa]|uniref:Reverse transcriptase domain-containing protein n=1 Tax=Riccia sorocarpa TaxID=122646 RepID=A0ABD3HF91_9MARC
MKKNKAPGHDGLTIDIVQKCWTEVGDSCVQMIRAVWAKRSVLKADCQGIIKLLPKGGVKTKLTNWRPISLMTLSYKIVSKILANRLRTVIPGLVDSQQSGFIHGRQISNNILSLRMAQEWAREMELEALFVKIDFVKAYDRVDHEFLWQVLRRMGFDERLTGLRIEDGRALVHQLFADDTGVFIAAKKECFQELKKILDIYERASGAKVNFSKTLIMPLGTCKVPLWARSEGCEIAEGEKVFKYLGVCAGVQVPKNAAVNELVRRLQRRMSSWENQYLSWMARAILLKHVLSQIPSFEILVVGCSLDESKKLEKTCREFLWGITGEGRVKKALVSWKKLTRPLQQGGLGILTFHSRSRALLMRYATAILEDKEVEWVWICKRWIRYKLISGTHTRDRKLWSCSDAMLLLDAMRIPEAPTVDRILQGWFGMKKKLRLDGDTLELPENVTIGALKSIWKLRGRNHTGEWAKIEKKARGQKVLQLRDLKEVDSTMNWGKILDGVQAETREGDEEESAKCWLRQTKVVSTTLVRCTGWVWCDGHEVGKTWNRANRDWSKLIWKDDFQFKELRRVWREVSVAKWRWRFKMLWEGSGLLKHKMWMWRILQEGLPTLERALKWQVSDGVCQACNEATETISHLFWECRRITDRVEWIKQFIVGEEPYQVQMMEMVDRILATHKSNQGLFTLWCIVTWRSWMERNRLLFDGVDERVTEKWIYDEVHIHLIAVIRKTDGHFRDWIKFNSELLLGQLQQAVQEAGSRRRIIRELLSEGVNDILVANQLDEVREVPEENSEESWSSGSSEETHQSGETLSSAVTG